MSAIPAALFLLALFQPSTAPAQGGDEATRGESAKEQDVRATELPEWSRDEAKAAVAAFKKAAKGAKGRALIEAAETLAKGRHPDVARELAGLLKNKDVEVRQAAARLLGTQKGDKTARKALAGLLKIKKGFHPSIAAEAMRSLGHVGYEERERKKILELFWAKKDGEVRQGAVQAFGLQRDKRAVSLLVALLDQPMPDDPNSASNPPASYWMDRYQEWSVYRHDVVDALERITGERFLNSDRAIAWIEEHGEEHGIELERVKSPWL